MFFFLINQICLLPKYPTESAIIIVTKS